MSQIKKDSQRFSVSCWVGLCSLAAILYSKHQFPSSKYVVYATALCIQRIVWENHRSLKKSRK